MTNLEIMQQFYECLNKGDAVALMALFTPDIEIHEPPALPFGGVYKGYEGVGALFAAAAPYFSPSDISVEAITVGDDYAVGHLTINSEKASEPASVLEQATIRDGKISRVRIFYFDPTVLGQ